MNDEFFCSSRVRDPAIRGLIRWSQTSFEPKVSTIRSVTRVFTGAKSSGHGPDESKNYPKSLWEAALVRSTWCEKVFDTHYSVTRQHLRYVRELLDRINRIIKIFVFYPVNLVNPVYYLF